MKNPNQYSGKNPIPGPKPFGKPKPVATAAIAPGATVVVVDPPANDASAAVAITSIEAKGEARPDSNVVVVPKPAPGAEAGVDALEKVKSGEQILADTTKLAASARPKS